MLGTLCIDMIIKIYCFCLLFVSIGQCMLVCEWVCICVYILLLVCLFYVCKGGATFVRQFAFSCTSESSGGHSHWKGVWGCAAVMTPFFQASRRSLAHQFTLNVPLLCPLFSIFRKFLHFQPCFGQNSSSLDPNFCKFPFPRPPFFSGKSTP